MEFNIPENIGLVPTAVHSEQLGAEAERKLATDINDLWSMHIQAQNTVRHNKGRAKSNSPTSRQTAPRHEAVVGTTRTQRPMVIIPAGTRNSADDRRPSGRETRTLARSRSAPIGSILRIEAHVVRQRHHHAPDLRQGVLRKLGVVILIVGHESENNTVHTLVSGLIGVLSPASLVLFQSQLAGFHEISSHDGLP